MQFSPVVLLLAGICLLHTAAAVNLPHSIGVFSSSLFDSIQPNSDTNYILSPLSVLLDLSMALFGARGNTATELERSLKLTPPAASREQIGTAIRQLLAPLQSKASVLHVVNKIYVNQQSIIRPQYNSQLRTDFFATAESLDFGDAAGSAAKINDFVAANTNNLIRDVIAANELTPDTRMVLVNAVHFKSDWLHKFQAKKTWKDTFYLADKTEIQTDFMHATVSGI